MWTHCYVTAKNTQSLLRSVYRRPEGIIGGHKVIKVGERTFAAVCMSDSTADFTPFYCGCANDRFRDDSQKDRFRL